MYGEIALFSGNGNPELAGEISAALVVPLCPADVFKFSNQNIFCRLNTSVRGKDVFIIQPIASSYPKDGQMASVNDNLMELLIMIDTANDAVVTIDEKSTILDWNATAERMFG